MIKLKHEMHFIKKEDSKFPYNLKQIKDCPDIIYVIGNTDILNDFSIAVVGSRIYDDYGETITKKLVKALVLRGICIVSGLANGIDTIAHREALENNGKTIAIIGNGFEKIYPPNNEKLADKIIQNGGAIISEYMPDQLPLKFCFPQRNRLVACMTEGTLVTEARNKSGALITANLAKQYDKKLFTIPGEIGNSKCEGNIFLLKNGAKIVTEVEDILSEYPLFNFGVREPVKQEKTIVLPPENYKNTYMLLNTKPIHINEICKLSHKAPQQVMADLTMLEMLGYIQSLPGGFYRIKY